MQATVETAYVYSQETDDDTRTNQIWKITYVSNGNYIIRPLYNLSIALTKNSSSYAAVADAESDDSDVSTNMLWHICHNSFGYAFKLNGDNTQTIIPVLNGPTGVPLYIGTWGSNMYCHWELESTCGIFLRDSTTLKTVNSSTEKCLQLSFSKNYTEWGLAYEYYGSLIGGMSWSSTDSSVATTVSYSGDVYSYFPGESVIKLSATLNGTVYTARFTVDIQLNALGYEIDFEPDLWTYDPVYFLTNCYSYALNTQTLVETLGIRFINPGVASGHTLYSSNINADDIVEYTTDDATGILKLRFNNTRRNEYEKSTLHLLDPFTVPWAVNSLCSQQS